MKMGMKMLLAVMTIAIVSCTSRSNKKRLEDVEGRFAKSATDSSKPLPPGIRAMQSNETKPEGPLPVIEFDNKTFDFGMVKEGEKVTHTYQVRNTGEAPLIIENARASCGCTTPEWTKEPIPVGGTGFVKAGFDSKGKSGMQNKTITITANTWPKATVLKFSAQVMPSDGDGPRK